VRVFVPSSENGESTFDGRSTKRSMVWLVALFLVLSQFLALLTSVLFLPDAYLVLSGFGFAAALVLGLLVAGYLIRVEGMARRKDPVRQIDFSGFRNIAEDSVQGIIVNTLDRTPLYANQKCAEFFGYENPHEIMALKDTLSLVSNSDLPHISELRRMEGKGPQNSVFFEFEGLRKDGSTVPLFGNAANIDWEGQPARFTTFFSLDEIRESEKRRKASEDRLRLFATISSDWFWELSENLEIVFISEHFEESSGLTASRLLGATARSAVKDLVTHDSYDDFLNRLDRHERVENLRIQRQRPGENSVWLQVNAIPQTDAQGHFSGYLGNSVDVTEIVETEKALAVGAERFKRATRGAKVTIWDWVIETDEYYLSKEAAEIYGFTPENKPQNREAWNELIHPDDKEEYEQRFINHIKGLVDVFEVEHRLLDGRGNYRWVQMQGTASRDNSGRALRVSGWAMDVTEQRSTERLMLEGIESLSEGFALHDAKDNLIAFNQKYAQMFEPMGMKIEVGQNFVENYRKVFEIRAEQSGVEIDEQHFSWIVEQHRNPPPYTERQINDGRWIRTTEIRMPSGGSAGLRIDVTEQHDLLERLAKSEDRFRSFADIASDWYFELDEALRYTFISEGVFRERGTPPESFLGLKHEEIFKNEMHDPTHQDYVRYLESHLPGRDILVRRTTDKQQVFWTRVNLVPKLEENGEFAGYMGASHDVTRQMRAQQSLEAKEAQVSGMLEIAPDAIIAVGSDLRVRIFNQGAAEIFGYQESEIMGQPLDALLPVRFRHIHKHHISSFRKSGVPSRRMGTRSEVLALRKDGSEFPAEASISRLELGDDTLFTVMLHDISEKKLSQQKVQRAMEEAQYANRAKSEFLANMSHELRTPLNAVLGFSQALSAGIQGKLNDKQVEYVDAVSQSGEHLLNLINDILDLSKLEAGKAKLEEESLVLGDLIKQSVLLISERANEGRVGLQQNLPAEPVGVRGDKRMILQILLNLLSNAVKFTPEGGSITVSAILSDNSEVIIKVADSGVGMPEEDIPHAMSTFGQLDGDLDRRHEGTGLGLPLVKSLVDLHGGKLTIESEPGKGTVVTVTLPDHRYLPQSLVPSSAD
jgi:PAS domain S-box-containing protein